MNTEPIIIETTLKAPVSVVWQAISDKEEMKQWYFALDSFEAKPDFGFEFTAGDDNQKWRHICKVKEVEPNKRLSYTWRYDDTHGDSLVTFDLTDDDGKTKLKLSHTGAENFAPLGKNFTRESFTGGWNYWINDRLKNYLEKPNFTVNKSILIDASPSRVWEVITNNDLIKLWAKGLMEGVYAETNWQKGSEVLWKMPHGVVCTKGVVVVNQPEKELKVDFYGYASEDVTNPVFSNKIGDYSETFEIKEQEGKTLLLAVNGKLNREYYEMFNRLWEKVMELIKEVAEKRN